MKISSRQQFAKALRSSDASERQVLLKSINQAFDEAQQQGKKVNQEVLDELYLCYSENGIDRSWYAYLLLHLSNKHSIEVAKKELLSTKNNKILLLAATHIARLPEEERIIFLSPLVMDASNAARCRAAANMLDDCLDRLNPEIALRSAIISDHELPLPTMNADTLSIWLSELQGPYLNSTEKALLQLGNEALEFMLMSWHKLPRSVRTWLMRTASKRNMAMVKQKLKETLKNSQDTDLLVTALGCIPSLKLDAEALISSLYDHSDPLIRSAAITAGNTNSNWVDRFVAEESENVRLAILDQISRLHNVDYIGFLVHCLKDHNWRVRARATDALVVLAPASLEPLRKALNDANEHVKVAAAKGLYRLGKEDWISADLHVCLHP